MTLGKVTRWWPEKGYGFARPDGGGEEVFLHISQFRPRVDASTIEAGLDVRWGGLTTHNGRVQAAEISIRRRLDAEYAMGEYVDARARERWRDAEAYRDELEADFVRRVRSDPADGWSIYCQAAEALVGAQNAQGDSYRSGRSGGRDHALRERSTEAWYAVEDALARIFEREQPTSWRDDYASRSYGAGGSFGPRAATAGPTSKRRGTWFRRRR